MKAQVASYFNRYVDFSTTEIDEIYAKLHSKTFQKKEFLLNEGDICRHSFFILNGVIRTFYIDEKGHEKITQFAIDNWWFTSIESFIKQTPSYLYIQAVETTSVLYLSKNDLELLYTTIPKLERAFRIITEHMLIASHRKQNIYLKTKSKERYYDFIRQFPDFAQRVPQYMIASYLEITPEYLSELRKSPD